MTECEALEACLGVAKAVLQIPMVALGASLVGLKSCVIPLNSTTTGDVWSGPYGAKRKTHV